MSESSTGSRRCHCHEYRHPLKPDHVYTISGKSSLGKHVKGIGRTQFQQSSTSAEYMRNLKNLIFIDQQYTDDAGWITSGRSRTI